MTYVPISMLEFLHVHYRDNSIFSTQIRVLEQDPLIIIIIIKKKTIWLVVRISIHFPSDTDDTSSYSYIQYEHSQENSALDSNIYDIC